MKRFSSAVQQPSLAVAESRKTKPEDRHVTFARFFSDILNVRDLADIREAPVRFAINDERSVHFISDKVVFGKARKSIAGVSVFETTHGPKGEVTVKSLGTIAVENFAPTEKDNDRGLVYVQAPDQGHISTFGPNAIKADRVACKDQLFFNVATTARAAFDAAGGAWSVSVQPMGEHSEAVAA